MKLFKKFFSAVAILTLIASVPMTASAATDVIDFEDGKIPASIQMALKDDGTPDGDPATLSVVDFNGSKMLKIDAQKADIQKVKFMVVDLVGEDSFKNVRGIEYDMILEQTNGTNMVEWNGGTVGATPTGPSGWANGTQWEVNFWDGTVSPVTHLKQTLTDDFAFTDASKAFFMYMNWGNKIVDIYLDNIKLLDKDGKAVALNLGAAEEKAEPVKEEKKEEKAEEKTEEKAADTATETTEAAAEVPKTGTASYAVYFAFGATVMAAGFVALKKRKAAED